jgi:hypothetical protein
MVPATLGIATIFIAHLTLRVLGCRVTTALLALSPLKTQYSISTHPRLSADILYSSDHFFVVWIL